MNDLISRKAAIDFIKKGTQGFHPQGYKTAVMDILDLIEQQDTAFDLESVIEQIKDKGTKICCYAKCNNDCENCEHGILMKSIIEILNSAANAADGKIGEVRE